MAISAKVKENHSYLQLFMIKTINVLTEVEMTSDAR